MTAKDAIKINLELSATVFRMLTGDLTDADFLVRPVPGANHFAWQIGHVITTQARFLGVVTGTTPDLPAGFAEAHGKTAAMSDDGFLSKAEYVSLFERIHAETLAAVDAMTEADLDKPNPTPMARLAPTFGAVLVLTANHLATHLGQLSVVRRSLGKPVQF